MHALEYRKEYLECNAYVPCICAYSSRYYLTSRDLAYLTDYNLKHGLLFLFIFIFGVCLL